MEAKQFFSIMIIIFVLYAAQISALSTSIAYTDNTHQKTIVDGQSVSYQVTVGVDFDATLEQVQVKLYDVSNGNNYIATIYSQTIQRPEFEWQSPVLVFSNYPGSGQYEVQAIATERLSDNQITRTDEIGLTVLPVHYNTAPVMSPLNDVTLNEGSSQNINAQVSDADGDSLICSKLSGPSWVSINPSTCVITIQAPLVNADTGYSVTVGVTDGQASDSESFTISVLDIPPANLAPHARFTHTPNSPNDVTSITFTSTSYDDDGIIVSSAWFIDGQFVSSQTQMQRTLSAGTHTIRLVVTDDDGASDYITKTLTVSRVLYQPTAEFSWSPLSPITFETVSFTDLGQDQDGSIVSWRWDFGDGTTSTTKNPTHTYESTGNFVVTLRVTDNDGAQDTVQHSVSVSNHVISSLLITADPDQGLAPLSVDFTCVASGGDQPYTYTWAFGDGDSSTHATTSHNYAHAGSYSASCTATDRNGDTLSKSTTIVVTDPLAPPHAVFSYSPSSPNEGDLVHFDARQSTDSDGTIISYAWSFGDGMSATGVMPTHSYAVEGSYAVTLLVTDNDGLTDVMSKTITVNYIPPIIIMDEFNCNEDVVQGQHLYCTAHVSDDEGFNVEEAQVTIRYENGSLLGTCLTNFKGYCHISPLIRLDEGYYDVFALAEKPGYQDQDAPLEDKFRVWKERYEIRSLDVYADDNFNVPENTFYRNEDMYAKFSVYDLINQSYVCDDSLVQEVFLRVNNAEPLPFVEWQELVYVKMSEPTVVDRIAKVFGKDYVCSYYYWLPHIPISDDYLGDGRVFAFTFNFADNSAGQDSKVVTVLNNEPSLNLPNAVHIAKIVPNDSAFVIIDVKEYVADVETLNDEFVYSLTLAENVYSAPISVEEMSVGVYKITAGSGYVWNSSFIVHADDTDGGVAVDSALIIVHVELFPQAPIAIAGPDQSVLEHQSITFDGSASYDPDGGDIISYTWNLGDGRTLSGATVTSTYNDEGVYTVLLTVVDDEGDSDSDSLVVTVGKEPYVAACSDGIDNDNDHLIDMNDPGCESPQDNNEFNVVGGTGEDGVKILSISTYGDAGYEKTSANDIITVEVVVENTLDEDIEDLRVTYSVPELGVKQKSQQFDLESGDRDTIVMMVYIPYDSEANEYYSEIGLANDELRRSTHRVLEVVN